MSTLRELAEEHTGLGPADVDHLHRLAGDWQLLSDLSFADLLHGPLAMTDPDVPVLAVVGAGPGGNAMTDVVNRLGERRADVVTIGPADVPGASGRLAVPSVDERYAPLLDILPLQKLALSLALARGEDPDAPRGLKKVTSTL